jgi:hypothetical protein
MSSHARLARCPLRPSSPTSHPLRRVVQLRDFGQLLLPFATEPEAATVRSQRNFASKPRRRHSQERVSTPEANVPQTPHPQKRSGARAKRKPPKNASMPADEKLLVRRERAAEMVSLSIRSIDYLLASKQLPFRKIGTSTRIPVSALRRFVQMNHPERLAS